MAVRLVIYSFGHENLWDGWSGLVSPGETVVPDGRFPVGMFIVLAAGHRVAVDCGNVSGSRWVKILWSAMQLLICDFRNLCYWSYVLSSPTHLARCSEDRRWLSADMPCVETCYYCLQLFVNWFEGACMLLPLMNELIWLHVNDLQPRPWLLAFIPTYYDFNLFFFGGCLVYL